MRAMLWLFLVFLYGCSATNDVVGHGPFQKRKYRAGWHVDIGLRNPGTAQRTGTRHELLSGMTATALQAVERIPTAEKSITSSLVQLPIKSVPPKRWNPPDTDAEVRVITVPTKQIPDPADKQPTEEPRRWNRMALVSGVFLLLSILVAAAGGGGIIGYIFTFSVLTGIIGLVLAIKHNERGKGIAIAAIAFPLAVLALVIAALNATW